MAKRNTRDILLDFTYKEVEKYGYFQASTTDILKKCSIPKGSMYHYFSSKHDLVLALINERIKKECLKLFNFKNDNSYIQSLIEFIDKIDFSKKNYKYGITFHKLYLEMAPLDKEFKDALDHIYDLLIKQLSKNLIKAIERDELRRVDTDILARFIVVTIFGFISLRDDFARKYLIQHLKNLKVEKKVKNKKEKFTSMQGKLF